MVLIVLAALILCACISHQDEASHLLDWQNHQRIFWRMKDKNNYCNWTEPFSYPGHNTCKCTRYSRWWLPTDKHFLNQLFVLINVIFRMDFFEIFPMIIEDCFNSMIKFFIRLWYYRFLWNYITLWYEIFKSHNIGYL